jgi:hypothetical protein
MKMSSLAYCFTPVIGGIRINEKRKLVKRILPSYDTEERQFNNVPAEYMKEFYLTGTRHGLIVSELSKIFIPIVMAIYMLSSSGSNSPLKIPLMALGVGNYLSNCFYQWFLNRQLDMCLKLMKGEKK